MVSLGAADAMVVPREGKEISALYPPLVSTDRHIQAYGRYCCLKKNDSGHNMNWIGRRWSSTVRPTKSACGLPAQDLELLSVVSVDSSEFRTIPATGGHEKPTEARKREVQMPDTKTLGAAES